MIWAGTLMSPSWSMCGTKIQKMCIDHEEFVVIVEMLHWHLDNDDTELMPVVEETCDYDGM
jgi:hypothetical protein